MKKVIIVTIEWPSHWEAWISDHPGCVGKGSTEFEAIARCILDYPDYTGVVVERKT